MSPEPVDLAEDLLAADDPATLYADIVDDWESVYGGILILAERCRSLAADQRDLPQLQSHLKGQSEGLYMALRLMRECRPEPDPS